MNPTECWTLGARNLLAGMLFMALASAQPAAAMSLEDLSPVALASTVYVDASYTDANTGMLKAVTGSGVVVSESGDVLTAYHVLKDWLAQTDEQKQSHPITVRIGSKFGDAAVVTFNSGDRDLDVALLKIRKPGAYASVPVCFVTSMSPGEPLYAFGFPNNQEVQPIAGTYGSSGADDNRWIASVDLDHGMSGGPVFNTDGRVVGIALGGYGLGDTTRLVTPVQWAAILLAIKTTVRSQCRDVAQVPRTIVASVAATYTVAVPIPQEKSFTRDVNHDSSSRGWDCRPFNFVPSDTGHQVDTGRSSVVPTTGNSRGELRDVTITDKAVSFNICAKRRITDRDNGFRHAMVTFTEVWNEFQNKVVEVPPQDLQLTSDLVIDIPQNATDIRVTVKTFDGRTYVLTHDGEAGDYVSVRVDAAQGAIIVRPEAI